MFFILLYLLYLFGFGTDLIRCVTHRPCPWGGHLPGHTQSGQRVLVAQGGMEVLGAVGAVQSKGISGAAERLINTKTIEFSVFNKTEKCIYNMKKYGDISTLSTGDKIKARDEKLFFSCKTIVTVKRICGGAVAGPAHRLGGDHTQNRAGEPRHSHGLGRRPGRQRKGRIWKICKHKVGLKDDINIPTDLQNKCRLAVGFLEVQESYSEEVDTLLLKKIWREMIEKKCSQNK